MSRKRLSIDDVSVLEKRNKSGDSSVVQAMSETENKMAAVLSQLHVLGDDFLELRDTPLGLGVFAKQRLTVGTPITQYYGEIITWKEARRRAALDNGGSHIRRLKHGYWAIDGKYLADGTEVTDARVQLLGHGLGAYCNDTNSPEKLNAHFAWVDSPINEKRFNDFAMRGVAYEPLPGETIVYLVVGKDPDVADSSVVPRDIEPGEEICVCYGKQYWQRAAIEKC
jgi:hypothetical protein